MKRGDIWIINLDPTIGAEIKKSRPAIIVNVDELGKLPLKIIVPITDWKNHYSTAPWMVRIEPNIKNGLSKESSADCFQVPSVSETRLIKKPGHINSDQMDHIVKGLAAVLKIN